MLSLDPTAAAIRQIEDGLVQRGTTISCTPQHQSGALSTEGRLIEEGRSVAVACRPAAPVASGRLLHRSVDTGNSDRATLAISQRIKPTFRTFLKNARPIDNPKGLLFVLLAHIRCFQPFGDANMLVSRLGANIRLIKNGLSPLSSIDMPEALHCLGHAAGPRVQPDRTAVRRAPLPALRLRLASLARTGPVAPA